jgi:cell division protein FtsA
MLEHLIVGIDIGTTKIAVLVAALDPEGGLSVLGSIEVPTPPRSMRQGVVVNIEDVSAAIIAALDRAEHQYGRKIVSAYVSLTGRHLRACNTRGVAAIAPGARKIAYQDMARAIEDARMKVEIDENREVVHQLPRGWVVDGQEGVTNPIGMVGYELAVDTHVVTASSSVMQNLINCVRQADVELDDLVSAPLAAAGAVLTPGEREMGMLAVDIGAETTSLAMFSEGFPWFSAVLPDGGGAITEGIARGLHLPPGLAEQLKIKHGHCDPRVVEEDELIELPDESQVIPRSELARIIEQQAHDLVARLRQPLQEAQRDGVRPHGIVLTGGTAELPGLKDLVQRTLGLEAHIGVPGGLRGSAETIGPRFATAAGLLLWGSQRLGSRGWERDKRDWRARIHQLTTAWSGLLRPFLP